MEPNLTEFEGEPSLCKIGRFIEEMDDQDGVNFEAALTTDWVTIAKLLAFLSVRGFHASDKAVILHRKRECCCGR